MPRIVDHAQRRATVSAVATDLIAERGLDAVTFREIADRSGFSTAIVSHYFADKRDVLSLAYRDSIRRARGRFQAALARHPGDTAAILESLLPLDADRRRDWRVWFAFWAQAAADAELAAEQRRRLLLTRADIAGMLPPNERGRHPIDAEAAARHILTAVMGMAAQAVFDEHDWTATRQREAIRELLHLLGY